MDRGTAPLARHDGRWRYSVGGFGDASVLEGQRPHRRVYEEEGFVPELQVITDDGLLKDEWSSASHHITLFADNVAVGHLRLIDRSAGPLPADRLWPDLDFPEHCWEVSALAVSRDHGRAFDTVKRLYRQAFHYAVTTECTHWVGVVEPKLLRILGRWFPMDAVGDPVEVPPSWNVPAVVSFADCDRAMQAGTMDSWFRPPTPIQVERDLAAAGVGQ